MERALKLLLKDHERLRLKEKTRYIIIDPDQREEHDFFRKQQSLDSRRKVSKSRARYTDGFFSSDLSNDSNRFRNIAEIELDTGPFTSPWIPQVRPKDN